MDRLMTVKDVAAAVSLSKATIYNRLSDKTFPRPVKVGGKAVRWRQSDIEAWIEGLSTGVVESRGE